MSEFLFDGMADETDVQDNPERWRQFRDYVGYEVSDRGRVRSFWGRGGETRGRRGLVETPKLVGGYVQRSGHKQASLFRAGSRRADTFGVHVLVLEVFVGPRPGGMEACHGNGDPGDNRLENLRWDTRGNNQRDTLKHGTHRHAKLTPEMIPDIWSRLVAGEDNAAIARNLGVGEGSICHIRTRSTWTHLTNNLPGEPAASLYDPRRRGTPRDERSYKPGSHNARKHGDKPSPVVIPPEFCGPEEIWRDLPGWKAYRVSNQGGIESRWERVAGGARGEFRLGELRARVVYPDSVGYMVFWASDGEGKKKMLKVHRCVLLAFVGEPPDGMVACHIDGNKGNNTANNLRWDTPSENNYDWIRAKRVLKAIRSTGSR